MQELKKIILDGEERFTLFRNVLDNNEGKLLLEYLEYLYKGRADTSNPNLTYYRLGQRDAISQIKAIVNKQKED